jgi:molybdopterin-containing oxidoreductase family molybdopterin binding subunit
MTGLALHLLNITLGNIDVPGGILGNRTLTPAGGPKEGPDGLLVPADFELMLLGPYPARKAQAPTSLNLIDLFPISSSAANPAFEEGVLEPEKYGLPYKPEALLHINSNFMMTASCPDRMAEVLKKIPFMVSFAIYLDETVQFADIVLPDTHNLERLIPFPNHRTLGMAVGPGPWYWPIAQPVSKPDPGVKSWMEVILELADRVGITDNKYTWEEIADTWAKSWFGKDKDLTWFKQHGLLVTEDKPVEQAYPRPFLKPRIPIYFEHFIGAGEDLEKVTKKMGTTWDISDYQPLPDWKPCPAYQDNAQGYDLYAINYKIPFHTSSFTAQNPWLDELGCYHPSAYKILINSQVAAKKNIKDGNLICIESREGRVKGEAKIVEGIHPEVVGVAGAFGHWTEDMPVAKGKGVHFNRLISSGLDRMDMISTVLDACVKVKAYRVEE